MSVRLPVSPMRGAISSPAAAAIINIASVVGVAPEMITRPYGASRRM